MTELTVKQLRDKLNELIEEGYGNAIITTRNEDGEFSTYLDIDCIYIDSEDNECFISTMWG